VGANIAEGCGRKSDADMGRFVQMARGSVSEAEYHLLLAHDSTSSLRLITCDCMKK
jgi:four helix bundle protein